MRLRGAGFKGGTMLDATQTKMIRRIETTGPEMGRPEAPADQAGPSGSKAQKSQAGPPSPQITSVRKPLFRT